MKLTKRQLRAGVTMPCGTKQFQLLRIDQLNIDPSYQRYLIESNVNKLVREFDPKALGTFKVGQRKHGVKGAGLHFITDAQHRFYAIKIRIDKGLSAPTEVLCEISLNSTQESEAEDFVKFNSGRAVQGNAKFKARLVYGCHPEVDIVKWIEEEGFEPCYLSAGSPSQADKDGVGVYSLPVIKDAYNRTNKIREALQFVRLVFGKAIFVPWSCRSGKVIAGVARFLAMCPENDPKVLALKFKAMHLDLAQGVADCLEDDKLNPGSRNAATFGKLIADWLYTIMCNGGSRRRAG